MSKYIKPTTLASPEPGGVSVGSLSQGSRDFTLVPWRDVLERNIGKAASGIMRPNGISWQFGRGRSGPVIS